MRTKAIFPGSAPIHCQPISSNAEQCRGTGNGRCGWSITVPLYTPSFASVWALPSCCDRSLNPALCWLSMDNGEIPAPPRNTVSQSSFPVLDVSSDWLALLPFLKFLSQRSHHLVCGLVCGGFVGAMWNGMYPEWGSSNLSLHKLPLHCLGICTLHRCEGETSHIHKLGKGSLNMASRNRM